MIKEIQFSGVTAASSPYSSPDGELDFALNLIPENDALRPIPAPEVVAKPPFPPVAVHHVDDTEILLMFDPEERMIKWSPLADLSEPKSLLSVCCVAPPAIAILGNTLVMSPPDGTFYALWNSNTKTYDFLGESIPDPAIEFALGIQIQGDSSFSFKKSISIPAGESATQCLKFLNQLDQRQCLIPPRDNADIFILSVSNAVFGSLNKLVADAHAENKFLFPFMIRWAIRLFDGSLIHHSAPILMIPNSSAPDISFGAVEKDGAIELDFTIIARRCSLLFRLADSAPLLPWRNIVRSVDVFVSAPVFTYDQSAQLVSLKSPRGEQNHSFSFSGVMHPEDSDFTFPDGNTEMIYSAGSGSHFNPASLSQKEIEDKISSVSQFYLIASISLFDEAGENPVPDMQNFSLLDMDEKSLSSLVARPILPDDWRSRDSVLFSHAFSYNSRLVLSGISSVPFLGFPVSALSQFRLHPGAPSVNADLFVHIKRDGESFWLRSSTQISDSWLPRFISYPDAAATEIRIVCKDLSGGWSIPLKSHDFLNLAFYFDGLGKDRLPKNPQVSAPFRPYSDNPPIPAPSKVILSEVNNPFFFPLSGWVSVGSGSVMATAAAVRALSQGQFGQFPIFAFSSEGVWALNIDSSGVVSSVAPVSRDVCSDPSSIAQIDSAVLFATQRGIMILSGSSSQIFSEILASPASPGIHMLPCMETVCDAASIPSSVLNIPPFAEFLKGCRILYDYPNRHIIIFNPASPVAYVYSMQSKLWGMMQSRFVSVLNSYSSPLAVSDSGEVLSLPPLGDDPGMKLPPQLLVSRPLKLDAPDVLKTVRSLAIRGHFPSASLKCVLYGSRDLLSWHLVSSSSQSTLSGFSGTPYKYFRLVIVSSLSPGDAVSSASFLLSTRFSNRLL